MARAENTNVPGPAWKEDTVGYVARGVPDHRAENFANSREKRENTLAVLSAEATMRRQIRHERFRTAVN